jgi:hypothetical protein
VITMTSNYGGIIKSYAQALKALDEKKRFKDLVNLEYATVLIRKPDDVLAIKLFDTEIVQYHIDGSIVLSSGGYRTVTTKGRINTYSPAHIVQDRGVWYLVADGQLFHDHKNQAFFTDGIIIDAQGKVKGGMSYKKAIAKATAVHFMSKRIKKYAKGFVEALFKGKVPQPSAGDCFYCFMHEVETDRPLGELSQSDHIELHFKERYYVPSLLVNATKMFAISPIAGDRIARLMAKEGMSKDTWVNDIARQQIEKSLVRYLKFCLKIAT